MTVLSVENLQVRYDAKGPVVLKDVSFKVEENDFLAIIGPSGAGKSTLIRCVNRLVEANAGKIQLDLPVVLSEYIGSQSVIVSDIGGHQILIEVGSDTPLKANEMLSFAIDPESIYLFDPQSEVTL